MSCFISLRDLEGAYGATEVGQAGGGWMLYTGFYANPEFKHESNYPTLKPDILEMGLSGIDGPLQQER